RIISLSRFSCQLSAVSSQPSAANRGMPDSTAASVFAFRCIKLKASTESCMFLKRDDPHLLIVGMTGVKMGDRFVQVGCAHGGRLAAVAGKVGLSGRAVLVAPDEAAAERGRKGAE